jgi:hypothetical protein
MLSSQKSKGGGERSCCSDLGLCDHVTREEESTQRQQLPPIRAVTHAKQGCCECLQLIRVITLMRLQICIQATSITPHQWTRVRDQAIVSHQPSIQSRNLSRRKPEMGQSRLEHTRTLRTKRRLGHGACDRIAIDQTFQVTIHGNVRDMLGVCSGAGYQMQMTTSGHEVLLLQHPTLPEYRAFVKSSSKKPGINPGFSYAGNCPSATAFAINSSCLKTMSSSCPNTFTL